MPFKPSVFSSSLFFEFSPLDLPLISGQSCYYYYYYLFFIIIIIIIFFFKAKHYFYYIYLKNGLNQNRFCERRF